MKSKIFKIAFVIIVLLLILFITNVQASGLIDKINDNIKNGVSSPPAQTVEHFGERLIRVIQVAGTGIAIIMLIYIAIKYMMVAPSEKAEFKKTAITFVIGAVIIFAATGILELIKKIMENLSQTIAK